ncbi:MAG: hypothetical protein K0S56_771 [Microvirga sp.]|jgi:hypothetical protein|nr:hypothetical protein [Microvirga sp.]
MAKNKKPRNESAVEKPVEDKPTNLEAVAAHVRAMLLRLRIRNCAPRQQFDSSETL